MAAIKVCIVALLATAAFAATATWERDPRVAQYVDSVLANSLKSHVETLVGFGTRNTLSAVNGNTGIGAARQWIKSQFESYAAASSGRMSVAYDSFNTTVAGTVVEIVNVVATLSGVDPTDNRLIIISGHYDSRASNTNDPVATAPGANDDASGTAVALEAARVLSTSQLPCTTIFVAFAAEEQGLLGSAHLADGYVRSGANIEALLNNDIVGGALYSSDTNLRDNLSFRVFSETGPEGLENDSIQRQLARYIKETADAYVDQLNVVLIARRDRYLRGGDQTSFTNRGFNAVRLTEMNENYQWQHQNVRVGDDGIQYGDLPQFVDYAYLAKVAQVNVATAVRLAWAPSSPTNVALDTRQLSNYATITWQPPVTGGSRLAGYYLLRRTTESSTWDSKLWVPASLTSIRVPYSVDNYLFAVQAVDEQGNASIAVPAR